MKSLLRFVTIVVIAFVASAAAETPGIISYQGRLTNSAGEVVADGSFSIQFGIYDLAIGGSPLWTETQSVTVTSGLFAVQLGSLNSIPASIFNAPDRWLGIKVGLDSELSPRQKLTSVAYAMRSAWADSTSIEGQWSVVGGDIYRTSGNVGIGTNTPTSSLDSRGTVQIADDATTPDTKDYATLGVTRAAHSQNNCYIGLTKQSIFPWGIGIGSSDHLIFGEASNSPLRTIPEPLMYVAPFSGYVGIGTGPYLPQAQLHVGGSIQARTFAGYGDAVEFVGLMIGPNNDVSDYGSAKSFRLRFTKPIGAGQSGGLSFDEYRGFNTNEPFALPSNEWFPRATLRWGNFGVGTEWPETRLHVANGDIAAGSGGEEWLLHTRWESGGDFLQITDRDAGGGWKFGQGIVIHSNGNIGIGTTYPTAKLFVNGDLCVTGAKNSVVPTSKGLTRFYAEESAGCWFSDYGEARLENGRTFVTLDPVFLEAVLIDEQHAMQVYLQEYESTNGLVVHRTATGFEVIEKGDGKSSGSFGWRVVAKRRDYENARMEVAGGMVSR